MGRKFRASWFLSELPSPFSPEARRRLIDANADFDAESRLAELERPIAIELRTRKLLAPTKVRRRELANVAQAAEQLEAVLAKLHPRTRGELTAALGPAVATLGPPDRFERYIRLYRAVVLRALAHDIPAQGGRPSLALRDRVIDATCAWVGGLQPLPARAAMQVAISRNAEKDLVHVPLVAPKDDLEQRCVKSVKIILADADLPTGRDVRAIVRKVLAKKPT